MSKGQLIQAQQERVLQSVSPTTLLVDAGNTRLKWALWSESNCGKQQAAAYSPGLNSPAGALQILSDLIERLSPDRLILVHVLGKDFSASVNDVAEKNACQLHQVNPDSSAYGINIAYENPAHFGADRLVALLAARAMVGNQSAIIIDCGTAVTIDALDSNNQHLGGVILPGLDLLSDALIMRTQAKHMSGSVFEAPSVFADNTIQGIGSGCLFTLVGAIEGICRRMQSEMSDETLKIICGGSAARVHAHLSDEFLLDTAALMKGLSVIAEQF